MSCDAFTLLLFLTNEVEPETENEKKSCEYVKTYVSPWEHAMKDNDELKATMKPQMPGPYVYKDLPQYKSFNRYILRIENRKLKDHTKHDPQQWFDF